ncbi:hypothetical protein Tco_0829144, partial [Tanacetum coccineum]
MSSSALDTNPSQPPASTPVKKEPTLSSIVFASGLDALANSTAEAHPGKSAPHDLIPQQQGRDEGTKNYTLDHIFAGINLNVLADKTKSVSEGLETVLTTLETGKGAKDDHIIVVDESEEDEEDKDEGIHADSNVETKDTSVPKPPSP